MYQQYELLAQLKTKEIEANAREAWKFTSLKKEDSFQKLFAIKKGNRKPEAKTYSCVTC